MRWIGIAALLFLLPGNAEAGPKFKIFGAYGFEEKFDTGRSYQEGASYIGVFVNYKDTFELQLLSRSSPAGGSGGVHISGNFHYVLLKNSSFTPFANLGLGSLFAAADSLHMNF